MMPVLRSLERLRISHNQFNSTAITREYFMKINYLSAPAGSGKTFAIMNESIRLVEKEARNVLIVQPTKLLIDNTKRDLQPKCRSVEVKAIHSETNKGNTRSAIIEYLNKPFPEPHVLLMTHKSFIELPYFNAAKNWALFIDETPQAFESSKIDAKITHKILTDHIYSHPIGAAYSYLREKNKQDIRNIFENASKDAALRVYAEVAQRINSQNHTVFVKEADYSALLQGKDSSLNWFGLLNPSIFSGFASVTIASARFEESAFFQLLSGKDIQFVEDLRLKSDLRYTKHTGGEHIEILYAIDGNWSKTLRDKPKVMEKLVAAIAASFGGSPFLWTANADVKDNLFADQPQSVRLPNVPHGLNDYQCDFDNVAFLAALNPPPELANFLKWRGLSGEVIKTAIYGHSVYQAVMRCSIRDPLNIRPKRIFVPDKETALWLQGIFDGSAVSKLDVDFGDAPVMGTMGRPRIHASGADRVKAFREKQKTQSQTLIASNTNISSSSSSGPEEPVGDVVNVQFKFDTCNESLLYNIDSTNVTYLNLTNDNIRFHGTIWAELYSTKPMEVINNIDHDAFIGQLNGYHQCRFEAKEHNNLISPAFFGPVDGVATKRGSENVRFANGIWLDFENGTMTHEAFSNLFPKTRMVIFNTWSSTKKHPRWRAYIPTKNAISTEDYSSITNQILNVVIDAGYRQKQFDPQRPHQKAHGIDLGKMSASNLFYLPCQAKDPKNSFFVDYHHNRMILVPEDWIQNSIISQTKSVLVSTFVTDEPLTTEQQVRFDSALSHWYSHGTKAGNGDQGLWKLATELKAIGLSPDRIEQILKDAARSATSPKDRINQISRIMKQIRKPNYQAAFYPMANTA